MQERTFDKEAPRRDPPGDSGTATIPPMTTEHQAALGRLLAELNLYLLEREYLSPDELREACRRIRAQYFRILADETQRAAGLVSPSTPGIPAGS